MVLSWPRRRSDHERVREHRGGDSGWRRPRQLRHPNVFPAKPFFFLLSLSHVVTCFSHLAFTHGPALCQGLARNAMNPVLYHTRLGSKLTLETTLTPLDNVLLSYNSRFAQTGIIHVLCFSFFYLSWNTVQYFRHNLRPYVVGKSSTVIESLSTVV